MSTLGLNELDCIFISYDEDNAEDNWADLLHKVPWAKRVHGVEGSDAAHKAAAELSETDLFIGVDADNIVDEKFFDQQFDFDHPKIKDKALSWGAKNIINGLSYGNGGLKVWPREYVLNMRTHENSDSDDPRSQIEFCWDGSYIQMNNTYCTTFPNGSPRQAFRAGFREGVKMSLDQGHRVKPEEFVDRIWTGNIKRLLTWCSVGADVENGLWAIYGARLGCVMTTVKTSWDFVNVRDFEYINKMWKDDISTKFASTDDDAVFCPKTSYKWNKHYLLQEIAGLGWNLRKDVGLNVAELDELQSKFFKSVQSQPPRMNKMVTEEEYNALRGLNE